MKQVAVLGDGAWGTAVASVLAANGYTVKLWCHNPEVFRSIKATHTNDRYLPGVQLDPAIKPVLELEQALDNVSWVFEAVPVKFLRTVLEKALPYYHQEQLWVILSKGIESDTLMLPTQIIDDVLCADVKKAVLSGPSFAHDLVRKQLTAVALAATDNSTALELKKMMDSAYFKTEIVHDLAGVQAGGALKNVLALGMGMLEGAGFSDNSRALFFTRGLHEMAALIVVLGGKQESLYALSGIGDLVLTAFGAHSKNRALGHALGKGETYAALAQKNGAMPEGVNSLESLNRLAIKHDLNLPLCSALYRIIFEQQPVAVLVAELSLT